MSPMKRPANARDPWLAESMSLTMAARLCHVSLTQLRDWMACGELDFFEYRGRLRIPKTAVAAKRKETLP